MAVVLMRPLSGAPLRVHLYHFLKFMVRVSSSVGEHQQLLVTTLEYLLSIALSPLYKVKIQDALNKVVGAVRVDKERATVRLNIKEYSCLYSDLMDKIVVSTDRTWKLPEQSSDPSEDVIKMDRAWQHAREQLEISTIWDLTPHLIS